MTVTAKKRTNYGLQKRYIYKHYLHVAFMPSMWENLKERIWNICQKDTIRIFSGFCTA